MTTESKSRYFFRIVVGVALFGVVTGFLANRFVGSSEEVPEAADPIISPGDLAAILERQVILLFIYG